MLIQASNKLQQITTLSNKKIALVKSMVYFKYFSVRCSDIGEYLLCLPASPGLRAI